MCLYVFAGELIADSCNICAFTTSVLLQLLFTEIFASKVGRLSFSCFPVRMLLHSTLAVADMLLLAGELLPFKKRQL